MTAPALIRKPDMMRAAEIANATGCRLEIKIGEAVITVIPAVHSEKSRKTDGVEYRRPQL